MKYVKIFGLLAVAATALMAFAASASATTVTTGGTVDATTIEATNESHLTLSGGGLDHLQSLQSKRPHYYTGYERDSQRPHRALTFTECNHHVV